MQGKEAGWGVLSNADDVVLYHGKVLLNLILFTNQRLVARIQEKSLIPYLMAQAHTTLAPRVAAKGRHKQAIAMLALGGTGFSMVKEFM